MKNVIFIPNIDLGDGRNKCYQYSVDSWSHFAKKNNCELLVWEDLLCPVEQMKITWQRYYVFDVLDDNGDIVDETLIAKNINYILYPEGSFSQVYFDKCVKPLEKKKKDFDLVFRNPFNSIQEKETYYLIKINKVIC